MSIFNLKTILPPPVSPNEAGQKEKWPLIDNNHHFPSDFIDFINCYGTGRIANFINIFNPFSENDDLNFFNQKDLIIEDFNYLIEDDKDYYRFSLYPNKERLLPIGVTDNGDYIFWFISPTDNSDSWKIAIIASRSPEVEYRQEDLTSFLEGVLSKKIKCMSFPDNFPPNNIVFESI
ncbi:SMI1/KNR4 family protein [Photorhabdus luminescens]|uniref:SMI1/KNR4 family protein n=1 Tax=Photorhabdus luminescens TaxID=29488 RepID=UPI0022404B47|nr:SMI1/KNR4 family protein [Photorhabdus luminescens]MCW7761187.1 SMI1/KNR4 family protein [Photorhabdus luminescens subsp. venezuelensis]